MYVCRYARKTQFRLKHENDLIFSESSLDVTIINTPKNNSLGLTRAHFKRNINSIVV